MGFDYALVHVYYTIPLAALLTLVYGPLFTRVDAYKLAFLVFVAVAATIPWDSYLIRNNVWGYPPDAVLGWTLFEIPVEEVFFFVIQTYNTSMLYFLLSKPSLHVLFLRAAEGDRKLQRVRWTAALLGAGAIIVIECFSWVDRRATYMKLIFVWAGPIIIMLWLLAYQLLINLHWSNTILPIVVPTLYLWVVDTIALREGTWVINNGTKLDWQPWRGMEIEEAVFFVVTNTLIVFGQVAFDNALAVLDLPLNGRPMGESQEGTMPSPFALMKALLVPATAYEDSYIEGFRQALACLRRKSRSFYLASSVFPRHLRSDLIILYSYCRLADDLIDNSSEISQGQETIDKLQSYLDLKYDTSTTQATMDKYISQVFPPEMHFTMSHLPSERLPSKPLYDLLEGFRTDLLFSNVHEPYEIRTEALLERYASLVASTVAEMCIDLIYSHEESDRRMSKKLQENMRRAGRQMGIALQYVNIARDIRVDAAMYRVYLPTSWLTEHGLTPKDILTKPDGPKIEALRRRLLQVAFRHYAEANTYIEMLPISVRGPVRVMIESYMEIGRTLLKQRYRVKDGRATVGRPRRLWIAWRALIAPSPVARVMQ